MMRDRSCEPARGKKPVADEKLSDEERKRIISRLHGLSSWVGSLIPEFEEVEGRRIPLRDVVFRYSAYENPTEEEIEGAFALALVLEKKAKRFEGVIEEGNITTSEARRLEQEVRGLLKAADTLRHLRGDALDVKAKAASARIQDEKRWLDFVARIR